MRFNESFTVQAARQSPVVDNFPRTENQSKQRYTGVDRFQKNQGRSVVINNSESRKTGLVINNSESRNQGRSGHKQLKTQHFKGKETHTRSKLRHSWAGS